MYNNLDVLLVEKVFVWDLSLYKKGFKRCIGLLYSFVGS